MFFGKFTFSKEEHPSNAACLISITELGIKISFNDVNLGKAQAAILRTLYEMLSTSIFEYSSTLPFKDNPISVSSPPITSIWPSLI